MNQTDKGGQQSLKSGDALAGAEMWIATLEAALTRARERIREARELILVLEQHAPAEHGHLRDRISQWLADGEPPSEHVGGAVLGTRAVPPHRRPR